MATFNIGTDPTKGLFGKITQGLPELRISEMFGGDRGSIGDTNPFTGQSQSSTRLKNDPIDTLGQNSTPQYQYSAPNTAGGGGGGGSWGSSSKNTAPTQQDILSSSSDLFTSAGYDKGDILRSLGVDPNNAESVYAQFGVDNASDLLSAVEQIGKSTMDYANKAEQGLRQSFNTGNEDIDRLIGESEGTVRQQAQMGREQLENQLSAGNQRKTDALTDAVRLYNELATGGQQRFGGASSAGEAFQAIAGQQLQRNRQQTATQYNQFAQEISTAARSLQAQLTNTLQNLDSQRIRLKNDARRDFQAKLLEIDRLRTEAGENKALARLNALQELRNQQFQIDMQIQQRAAEAQQVAQQYATQLQQAMSSVNSGAISNEAGGISGISQPGQNPFGIDSSIYVGNTGRREDAPVGNINPLARRPEDMFFA